MKNEASRKSCLFEPRQPPHLAEADSKQRLPASGWQAERCAAAGSSGHLLAVDSRLQAGQHRSRGAAVSAESSDRPSVGETPQPVRTSPLAEGGPYPEELEQHLQNACQYYGSISPRPSTSSAAGLLRERHASPTYRACIALTSWHLTVKLRKPC